MPPSNNKKRTRTRRSPSESPLRAKRGRSNAESSQPPENPAPEGSSSTALPVKVEWPLKSELWNAIGDPASCKYLRSQTSLDKYRLAVKAFAARLSLVVHGVSSDQISSIRRATAPDWYETADRANKENANEAFEDAVAWTEAKLEEKIKFYARRWFETDAGNYYPTAFNKAK